MEVVKKIPDYGDNELKMKKYILLIKDNQNRTQRSAS